MTDSPATPGTVYEALVQIGIIDQLASSALERVLPDGLRLAHFTLLTHLSRRGGAWSPARLANALQVTRGAITNTVARLESRGLVKVTPDPDDGRGKMVRLTGAGAELHARAIAAAVERLSVLSDRFTQSEFEAVLPFLNALRDLLDRERPQWNEASGRAEPER
ncbi:MULTISPECIES: MarR family winged helix-turn-helix transcriptional regulator [Hyphobacterium]|uniref:MarR family winged helix-turn-helix transcriptional regulator n=1 Tax=Hyphobacterium vulgare TaxID=1736751 RepID=A0ABV6ZVZ9_9PROT